MERHQEQVIRNNIQFEMQNDLIGTIHTDDEYWYLVGQCYRYISVIISKEHNIMLGDTIIANECSKTNTEILNSLLAYVFNLESKFGLNNCLYTALAMILLYSSNNKIKTNNTFKDGFNGRMILE